MTFFSKKYYSCLVMGASLSASCMSGRHVISQRPVNEPGSQTVASSRDIAMPPSAQDVYTKQRVLNIKPVKKANTTGSLVALDDPRSYPLASMAPLAVGTFLNIKTATNADAAKPAAAAGAKPTTQNTAQIEQDLLKSLPTLDPAPGEKDKPVVIPGFKVEVLDILDNGDALVAYHRRSVRGDQASDVWVKARIPQSSLMDKDNLTTANLADVDFRESRSGEVSERYSAEWEDEYTLRMSGFDEARSKSAVVLDEQRRQIKETRDKLASQIKSFSTERQTVAKERSDLVAKEKADAEKLKEMEQKIKDQEGELEKLKPKEEEKLAEDAPPADGKTPAKPAAPAKAGTAPAAKPAAPKPVAQAAPAAPNGGVKK